MDPSAPASPGQAPASDGNGQNGTRRLSPTEVAELATLGAGPLDPSTLSVADFQRVAAEARAAAATGSSSGDTVIEHSAPDTAPIFSVEIQTGEPGPSGGKPGGEEHSDGNFRQIRSTSHPAGNAIKPHPEGANDVAAASRAATESYYKSLPVSGRAVSNDPAPLTDQDGVLITNRDGEPILRPSGLDPKFFIDQGLQDGETRQLFIAGGEGEAAAIYQAAQLKNFFQGGAWDAQRLSGTFDSRYVDYATVAIGIYASAAGLSLNEILAAQSLYARLFSPYSNNTQMDEVYTYLPASNVFNTYLGYDLYVSGRLTRTGPRQ